MSKNEGGHFGDIKKFLKVLQCRKNRPGFVCYAKKKGTIMVQFPGSNGTIWPFKIL